ncbi:MAG: hypothetical protein GXY33_01310 [Phycisphaerae bacterium]|nr:hypothetical protein [Phycisphaerae bacterium]
MNDPLHRQSTNRSLRSAAFPAAVIAAGLFAVYLISIVSASLHHGLGFTLDDGWIHLAYARNLADFGVWGLNPDQPSAGDTSILYVLALTPAFLLNHAGVLAAYAVNLLALIAVAVLAAGIARELVPASPRQRLLLVVLVAACGNLIWYAFTGMETLLMLALGLAAIRSASAGRHWTTGLLIVLTGLTRPEGITVGLAVAAWAFLHRLREPSDRCRRASWLIPLAACAAAVAIGLIWQHAVTGQWLPTTLQGRSWIIGQPPGPALNPLSIAANVLWLIGVWGYRLLQFSFGQAILVHLGLPGTVAWIVSGLAAAIALVGFIAYLARAGTQAAILLIWAILHLLAYAVFLPTRGHAGRYQPMVLILAMLCLGLGILWLIDRPRSRPLRTTLIALASVVVAAALGGNALWIIAARQSITLFDRVHLSAAAWLHSHTASDARVAAFDIGAIAYLAGRTVIDVGGLCDPDAARALYNRTIPHYLRQRQTDYLAMIFPYHDPDEYLRRLDLQPLLDERILQPVQSFSFSPEPILAGKTARVVAGKIVIYRLNSRP